MGIKLAILTIGTELTTGLVPDINSYYLSTELFNHSFDVARHVSVADDKRAIITAISELHKAHEVILTSGGLGPTDDDITREAVAGAMGVKLVIDDDSLAVAKESHPLKAAQKLSSFPEGSTIIKGARYMAGGFFLKKGSKAVISLPGVPDELKEMFHGQVLPLLLQLYKPEMTTQRRLFKIANLKEMEIEQKIAGLKNEFSYGLLPKLGEIHLYVTVKNPSAQKAAENLAVVDKKIEEIFGPNLFARDEKTLEEEVIINLINKGLTIATAESATGGLVGQRLSSIAGSSGAFVGGYITYAYELKEKLGVPKNLLMKKGAVDSEVAALMASNTRKKAASDIAITVTGIAGPGGATKTKPVGLHYIGIDSEKYSTVREFVFSGNRAQVRWQASQAALLLVRESLIQ